MRSIRKIGLVFFVVALLLLLVPSMVASAAGERRAPLSPAISVLAKNTDLSLWGLVSETQILDAECFLRGLNLGKLDSVRISSLPDRTIGRLSFCGEAVQVGQTFSSQELSRLSFEPTSKRAGNTSFLVEINDCGVDYSCNLFLLTAVNRAPEISGIPTLLQKLYAYQNSQRSGRFYAEDPEGDSVGFEIASYPKYGSLTVSGESYCYRPFPGYAGEDSFTYVARDQYGNYSRTVKVSVLVRANGADLVFSDLDDPALQSAARTLACAGILGGTKVGNATYFYPDRAITRAEFLVAAMSAVGMSDLPACKNTGFADDEKIPDEMKPYVLAAYRLGYIDGKVKDGEVFFLPAEKITKGEAVNLLEKLLLPDVPKTQKTALNTASGKTEGAVAALSAIGVIPAFDVGFSEKETFTRGEAAKLLENVFLLTQGEKF